MGEEFIHSGSVALVFGLLLPSAVLKFRGFWGTLMLGESFPPCLAAMSDVMSDAEAPGR